VTRARSICPWLPLLSCCGCITIATSYGAETAIERQLLGAYEELDQDLILASSVRGDVAAPPGSYESVKALAIEGRALQTFNQDDLELLETKGCVVEALDATIRAAPCPYTDAPDEEAQRAARTRTRVIAEENRARKNILTWAAHAYARADGRGKPSSKDFLEIKATYHRLLEERAKKGERFEVEPGVVRELAH
jgi:hypothetical protein